MTGNFTDFKGFLVLLSTLLQIITHIMNVIETQFVIDECFFFAVVVVLYNKEKKIILDHFRTGPIEKPKDSESSNLDKINFHWEQFFKTQDEISETFIWLVKKKN